MTPRERWISLLSGNKPDRVPTDYWATSEVTTRLLKELRCADIWQLYDRLHIDGVRTVAARPTVRAHAADPLADIWGVRHRTVDYGTGTYGEVVHHPLAGVTHADQVHAFRWPSVDDFAWDEYQAHMRALPRDRAVRCGGYEPFLLYCSMRGMEQAMMDLLTEPEIADAILGHIFDYHYGVNERLFDLAQGRIDLTYVAEDLGSQHGLLMSLALIRRFLLPNQKRMADLARSHGIHVFYHTDGAARDVIPDLIDVTGIEVLNPIQWRCPGMEREGLVRDFGKRIGFHGSIDNQYTLPFGTPAEVRQEVLDALRIFAPARWICAPCHNLQPVTPTANIVALYETVYDAGRL